MTEQLQGPIYEYMMGTFDLHDPVWMSGMNDMLNNFGLAGWKRSVVTLLDARHVLVVMERRFPSAAEYAATKAPEVRRREPEPEPEPVAEPKVQVDVYAEVADEFDDEAEAMMAAKVAEVIPWAARPKVPANGRRKRKAHKKVSAATRLKQNVT